MTTEIYNGIFANVTHGDGTDLPPEKKFAYSLSLALNIIEKSSVDITNDNRRPSSRWRPDGSEVRRQQSNTVNHIRSFMIEHGLADHSPNYSGSHTRVFDIIRDVKKEQRLATPSGDTTMLYRMLPVPLQKVLQQSKNPNILENMVKAITDNAKGMSDKGIRARIGQNSRMKMQANSAVFQVLRDNDIPPHFFTGFQGDVAGLLTMMKQARSLAATVPAAVAR